MQTNDTPRPDGVKSTRATNPLPFAPIPYAMLRDKRLTSTDIQIAGLILERLCDRTEGYATNRWLGQETGLDPRSVRRSIHRLGEAGWFRFDPDNSKAGRKIVAIWRHGGGKICPGGRTKMSGGGGTKMSSKEEEPSEEASEELLNVPSACYPLYTTLSSSEDDDPHARIEEIVSQLGSGANGDTKRLILEGRDLFMAILLDRPRSKGFHRANLEAVASGELSGEMLLGALQVTMDQLQSREGCDLPAAYFVGTLKNMRNGTCHADIDAAFEEETYG